MTEHDEQRRLQMDRGVLQGAQDFGGDHVAGDPDDEQLAESRVEDQLGRHPRVAAAENGRVRLLAPSELGENLLLHGREPRLAADETLVARDEARKRLIGRMDT